MTRFAMRPSDRFRRLIGSADEAKPMPRASVQIVGGLHTGANIRVDRSPMTIGSSSLSDIVLRDTGVTARHAEIVFNGARWTICVPDGGTALPVQKYRVRGRFLREIVKLGKARVVLSQPATESATEVYEPHLSRHTAIGVILFGALVCTGLVFAKVHRSEDQNTLPEPPPLSDINLSAWPDVSVSELSDGTRQVTGFVDTLADRQDLLDAISWRASDDMAKLRTGEQLATQLRQVLDSQAIKVRYVGGGVMRLTGEITDQSERDRVNWVLAQYETFMTIDNLAEYVPEQRAPVRRALPFRIVDVIPGEGGSFGDQNGNRYFIGARLPDGSKLIAVREDAVEFELNNEPLIYPLK